MRRFSTAIMFICISILAGCRQQPAEQLPEKKTSEKTVTVKPEPFVAPEDSCISEKQLIAWQACNPLLDSLTFRYTDSFKTDDPAALLRYQEDFITAQDKICVRAGLPGGYREYTWILQFMGIEKNREVLKAANAQSF